MTERNNRSRWTFAIVLTALTAGLAAQTVPVGPAPSPRAFLELESGYTQEILGAVQLAPYPGTENYTPPLYPIARVLGGVAFAPNGEVWAADCLDLFDETTHESSTVLHRLQLALPPLSPANLYHDTPTLHQSYAVNTSGGCGLTNHPNKAIYSNSRAGVYKLDAETGARLAGPFGYAGNALGITTDPQTGRLVYPGDDCDGNLSEPTCTIWSVGPDGETPALFAQFSAYDPPFSANAVTFVDGLYFDPTGQFLFITNRAEQFVDPADASPQVELNALSIYNRDSGALLHLPMTSEPDGVSFHATEQFVITNDEKGGTMTRFDFPNGFAVAPTPTGQVVGMDDTTGEDVNQPTYGSVFATGGHRGDLTQVGKDGCIYATQGRDFEVIKPGTRYDDGTETTEDSVVKICAATGGGFTPGAGVTETVNGGGGTLGTIAGSVFLDVNKNHVRDAGEPPLGGAVISLNTGETTTSAPDGSFAFSSLPAGTYTVTATSSTGYLAGEVGISTPSPLGPFELAAGETKTVEFGYAPGSLAGTVYRDINGNGVRDAGEPALPGVTVTLSGVSSSSQVSAADGSYAFHLLASGNSSVSAPDVAVDLARSTTSPLSWALAPAQDKGGLDFGYKPGSLSGFAYVDANRNGVKDTGEAGIGGVTITGPSGTATTAADGSYSFSNLDAATYSVSAPSTAAGKALFTASPLSVTVAAGGSSPNNNFGYVTGALSGFAYVDANRNGVKDTGEAGIGGVTITGPGGSTTTAADGSYSFSNLDAGTYSVSAPSTAAGKALFTASPLSVTVAAGGTSPNNNFGYVTGGLSGFAYVDANLNGVKDTGEAGIGGVAITGPGGATALTAPDGSYSFVNLNAGIYNVSAPAAVGDKALFTTSPLVVTLAAGALSPDNNFGYVPTKSALIGPSSMEGAIKISNGDWVNGGYSMKSTVTTNLTIFATVTITGPCSNGGTDTVVIPLRTMTYADPADETGWLPTGDANSVLSWQGSVQVGVTTPPICGGVGKLDASKGAVFNSTFYANPSQPGTFVTFRFKFRDPAAKGKPNTNCLDTSDPNRNKADVCGASWSATKTFDP